LPASPARVRADKSASRRNTKRHNRLVAKVRFVVEHPFAWMKARGWGHARYRGVARNGLDFALNLLAWNLHRARDLLLTQRALSGA
jgi:IS5 family transposase